MQVLPLIILIPLTAGFIIPIFAKRLKAAADAIASFALFAMLSSSVALAGYIIRHKAASYSVGGWARPFGIELFADAFSAFMIVTVNLIGLAAAVYSIGYMRTYTDKWKYYSLFMLMMAGVNGLLMAGDIFNMFVFLEIASISIYALVAFGTEPSSFEASFKYAVMGAVASSFILLGIAVLYAGTSTLNFKDMAQVIALNGCAGILPFVSVLFLAAFSLKAAAVPFHAWLPDAYSTAPATIPAVSSGIIIKSLGVYALARIFFNVFGMTENSSVILTILAVMSIAFGSILAFAQTNIRRLFGYSSISQVGYILLGLGVGTPLAILGSIFHLFNHSAAKSLLFLDSGIVENIAQTNDIAGLRGASTGRKATGYTMLSGALSISGVPPFAGFWSKLIIILACIQAGHPALAFIAVLASILTLAYYFRALSPVIFGSRGDLPLREGGMLPGISMKMAVVILSAVVLLGGLLLLPGPANTLLTDAAAVLARGSFYARTSGVAG